MASLDALPNATSTVIGMRESCWPWGDKHIQQGRCCGLIVGLLRDVKTCGRVRVFDFVAGQDTLTKRLASWHLFSSPETLVPSVPFTHPATPDHPEGTYSRFGLFKPLDRRPQATTITVRDLIQKVQAGAVRIPQFQRPLRWRAEDVRLLFDSIWRGYPVGSLLVWEKAALAAQVKVGGATLQVPEVAKAWWVVDGQQRTTALAAALLDLDHLGDHRWIVRFDPEKELFKSGPVTPDRKGLDVPLSGLGDLRRLGRWLRDSRLEEELINRVEIAQQRLLDYGVPTYVVDTEDEAGLRGVFARLNSTGSHMRAEEVFQALLGAPAQGSTGKELDLKSLQQVCNLGDFGAPDQAEILKAVLAMSGADPSRRLEAVGEAQLTSLVSREQAEDALRLTVGFLQDDCGIPHVTLIPYPVTFSILARWFYVFPHTSYPTRKMLARWFWRGAHTGVHQRAEVSRMREQVGAIREDNEGAALQRLLDRVAASPASDWTLGRFNLKSAQSRIEILALLSLVPRDTEGPLTVDRLIGDGDRIAREIFLTRDLAPGEGKPTELRTAANRVLLSGLQNGLFTRLRQWQGHDDVLRSHLIDPEMMHLLIDRRVTPFLKLRANSLRSLVSEFLAKRCEWDRPILRPLSSYLDPDDGILE